ncbi:DUF3011 domain-containing protein [Chthonobacter albigriseus]|uniref:DUF3011 domain-containing protein n=1 Tax=Chthonobacter albigriseus TaxID=1683161 RepID=UPI0015EE569A|nr:DUF3011 domain-containing protein [Chthonobacter albigriseus]
MPLACKPVSWLVAASVALASVPLGAVPAVAETREVSCASRDSRYNTCYVPGIRSVELIRQVSDAPCRYRVSWGVTDDRIWVDRGCRGVFAVEIGGYRPPRPDPEYGFRPPYPDEDYRPQYPDEEYRPPYPDEEYRPGSEFSGDDTLGLLALLAIVGAAAALIDKNDRVPGDRPSVDAAKLCKAYAAYDMKQRGATRIRSNTVVDVDRIDRRSYRVSGEIVARFRPGDRRVRYTCRTSGDQVTRFGTN